VMAQVGVWTSNDLRKGLTLGAGYQNLGGKDQFCASLSFVGIPF